MKLKGEQQIAMIKRVIKVESFEKAILGNCGLKRSRSIDALWNPEEVTRNDYSYFFSKE